MVTVSPPERLNVLQQEASSWDSKTEVALDAMHYLAESRRQPVVGSQPAIVALKPMPCEVADAHSINDVVEHQGMCSLRQVQTVQKTMLRAGQGQGRRSSHARKLDQHKPDDLAPSSATTSIFPIVTATAIATSTDIFRCPPAPRRNELWHAHM